MTEIERQLEIIKYEADLIKESLNKTPEKAYIADLLKACTALDNYYKQWCDEGDEDCGDAKGTTYNSKGGISMEFYIEASDWHQVSLALRKLTNEE